MNCESYYSAQIFQDQKYYMIVFLEIIQEEINHKSTRNHCEVLFQLESDGSRSGSSLSLRNTSLTPRGQESSGAAQSPSHSHRGVHRSVSATNSKPSSRRASSGGETIRELKHGHRSGSYPPFSPPTTNFILVIIALPHGPSVFEFVLVVHLS